MHRLRLVIGLILGFSSLIIAGEFYSRKWPPQDVLRYFGESSPLTGPYRPDPVLGADYVSLDALQAQYTERLAQLGPFQSPRRTWAWFGNSFVQANGMLGDMAAAALPDVRMFYLRRNEPLNLRVAQARMLLQAGLRPERIFFVMLPIDVIENALRPLSSIIVTSKGAITYDIGNPPFPLDELIAHSLLARVAWVRKGGADRAMRRPDVTGYVSPLLASQLAAMLGVLSNSAGSYDVPITLVLLPNREQVFGTARGFALQDLLTKIATSKNMDVFDARRLFDGRTNKTELFIPDWHFSSLANKDVLDALLAHLAQKGIHVSSSSGASL
jgi:hypothetical protein